MRNPVENGNGLHVHVVGSDRPPLILLNAFGQNINLCMRLAERLSRHHTVFLWAPRGIEPDDPFDFDVQVTDVLDVLDAFAVRHCDIVAWCTGPKVALAVAERRPAAVDAMVFLNGSFKRLGQRTELDTPYERDLEAIARFIDRDNTLAERVAGLLADGLGGAGMNAMPPEVRDAIRWPFRSAATLVRYVRQLMDFWSRDLPPCSGDIPVLCVGAEHDAVVSPIRFREASRAMPGTRYVEIAGATHHCLYERADLVADIIEQFLSRS